MEVEPTKRTKRTLIIGALPNEPHIVKYKEEHQDEEVYTIDERPIDNIPIEYDLKFHFIFDFNNKDTWFILKSKKPFDLIIFDYSVGSFVTLDDKVLINTYLYDILKEGGSIYIYDDIEIQGSIEKWVKIGNDYLFKLYCEEDTLPLLDESPIQYTDYLNQKCNSIKKNTSPPVYKKKNDNEFIEIDKDDLILFRKKAINLKYFREKFKDKYTVIKLDNYPLKNKYDKYGYNCYIQLKKKKSN